MQNLYEKNNVTHLPNYQDKCSLPKNRENTLVPEKSTSQTDGRT